MRTAGPDLFCHRPGEAQVLNLLSLSSACQHVVNGKLFLLHLVLLLFCLDDSFAARVLLTFMGDWLVGWNWVISFGMVYNETNFYLTHILHLVWRGQKKVKDGRVAHLFCHEFLLLQFVLPGHTELLHPVPALLAGHLNTGWSSEFTVPRVDLRLYAIREPFSEIVSFLLNLIILWKLSRTVQEIQQQQNKTHLLI